MSDARRNAKRRGDDFERSRARDLQRYGFENARRGQVFNGEPDIVGVPGWHFEMKNHKTTHVTAWWEQAEKDAAKRKDGVPVVVFSLPGHHKPMALITWKTFLGLIGKEMKE